MAGAVPAVVGRVARAAVADRAAVAVPVGAVVADAAGPVGPAVAVAAAEVRADRSRGVGCDHSSEPRPKE